jgi:hypothetical protein
MTSISFLPSLLLTSKYRGRTVFFSISKEDVMVRNCSKWVVFCAAVLMCVLCGVSSAQPAAANVSGSWTIYANNIDKPGSSLKAVQITQNGNIITGRFKGPNQSGKIQGWVNGNHVEFSTDTRTVLTFRGQLEGGVMSGLYGINGRHAEWRAEMTE